MTRQRPWGPGGLQVQRPQGKKRRPVVGLYCSFLGDGRDGVGGEDM